MANQTQPEGIARVRYRPSDTARNKQHVPLWQWALGALLLTVLATLWFLFTAKSVVLTFSPQAQTITIQGGVHLKLGNVFLMREGNYTVDARTQNHKPLQRLLNVSQAANQSFQYFFTPTPGVIELTRRPADARVFVDGIEVTLAPNAAVKFSAEAGLRQLKVQHPRYLAQTVPVDITGKSITQNVRIELAPAWADVNISSEPIGAEIWIDNRNSGQSTPAQVEAMHPFPS